MSPTRRYPLGMLLLLAAGAPQQEGVETGDSGFGSFDAAPALDGRPLLEQPGAFTGVFGRGTFVLRVDAESARFSGPAEDLALLRPRGARPWRCRRVVGEPG